MRLLPSTGADTFPRTEQLTKGSLNAGLIGVGERKRRVSTPSDIITGARGEFITNTANIAYRGGERTISSTQSVGPGVVKDSDQSEGAGSPI